jgi:hypothetical protein
LKKSSHALPCHHAVPLVPLVCDVQALVASGLPTALCRLVVRATTPPEQRLQALTMLRVLAADPATHKPMMEAKVLHSLVQQVGRRVLVCGW